MTSTDSTGKYKVDVICTSVQLLFTKSSLQGSSASPHKIFVYFPSWELTFKSQKKRSNCVQSLQSLRVCGWSPPTFLTLRQKSDKTPATYNNSHSKIKVNKNIIVRPKRPKTKKLLKRPSASKFFCQLSKEVSLFTEICYCRSIQLLSVSAPEWRWKISQFFLTKFDWWAKKLGFSVGLLKSWELG